MDPRLLLKCPLQQCSDKVLNLSYNFIHPWKVFRITICLNLPRQFQRGSGRGGLHKATEIGEWGPESHWSRGYIGHCNQTKLATSYFLSDCTVCSITLAIGYEAVNYKFAINYWALQKGLDPQRKHPIQHLAFSRPIPDTWCYGSHWITTTCLHASWWNLEPVSLVSGRLYFIWWNKLTTSVTPEPVTGPRRTSGGLEPGLKWNERRAVRGVRSEVTKAWCLMSVQLELSLTPETPEHMPVDR